MSPLRWMQSTVPHWTVMLVEVTLDTVTQVGAVDGADKKARSKGVHINMNYVNLTETIIAPDSWVNPVTLLLISNSFAFKAITVMV